MRPRGIHLAAEKMGWLFLLSRLCEAILEMSIHLGLQIRKVSASKASKARHIDDVVVGSVRAFAT